MTEPLDLLAIMAHPDDAELLCGGALSKAAAHGDRVGILDLTRGEAASTGSAEIREREAARASEVMGLAVRRNAGLRDSGLINDDASRSIVVGRRHGQGRLCSPARHASAAVIRSYDLSASRTRRPGRLSVAAFYHIRLHGDGLATTRPRTDATPPSVERSRRVCSVSTGSR